MHEVKGATVRQNVRLPSLLGGRLREFDVLVDGTLAGYPIRLAIECKNERELTGAPKIDAFVGKLGHVGIPTQHGIFVSAKGFTKGALDRARQAGVRALILTGLTDDRLAAVMYDAFQSVIFLLPVVLEWQVLNDIPNPKPEEMFLLRDESGNVCGSIADLIWRAWYEGSMPREIGVHHLQLRMPMGWRQIVNECETVPISLTAQIHVYGIAISLRGAAARHDLIDATTAKREKTRVTARFSQNEVKNLPFRILATQDERVTFLEERRGLVQVTTEAPLPRLAWNGLFWPPSERYMNAVSKTDSAVWDNIENQERVNWALQGGSLDAMWDPLWVSPMLQGILNAKFSNEK
jgi:hypothetical protein